MVRTRRLVAVSVSLAIAAWLSGHPRPVVAQKEAPSPPPKFPSVGVDFLKKHCLDCHGEKTKRADLSLHTYRDDQSLIKDRKVWHKVLHMVQSGEMPPAKRPRPSAADLDAFIASVNGVFDHHDRTTPADPGRVTIRRLNRTEYNNTIRDLVGVDFNPAEDFPSDDVGHGFDNIGDVLTLSPVLMERYLSAAESIVQRAIVAEPPKPPQRRTASRWLEPATSAEYRWRPVHASQHVLHTLWHLTMEGEYTFRFRAYAKRPDKEPVKVVVLLDGKEVKTLEITAEEKTPTIIEVPLTLTLGDRRTTVKVLNHADGDKPRTLLLEYMELTGPKDTRPATQRKLLATTPGKTKAEQTREVLTRFVSRAYRRPANKDEAERLARLVEAAETRGERWEAGMQLAFQAVLVSPKFLFRVELDEPGAKPQAARGLDEYQLASRLSYFLWSSMPDDELFDLAGKKQLTANLDAQVRRMLKDPKAKALTENFALQWLQLRRLKEFAPDPKLFPSFNEQVRADMLKETSLFFNAVVQEDRSVLDLIDADFTFLNERLARHYGISDTKGNWVGQKITRPGGQPIRGDNFVRVELSSRERGGILTQASVLTVTSNPTRTSPVKRGRWVLEQILGTPPPPPPPDVPELKDDKQAMLTGSLRQRMEQHRTNPACANCHARMDPLGFAFENYNAIGAYRTKDGDFPIDPAGELPGGATFKGAVDLKAILKGKKELFARCLTEKMLTYAVGRGLEYYDRRTVDQIVARQQKDDYRFSTLVIEIVKSDPFRMRRGNQ